MSEDKASELLEEAERRLHAGDYAAAERASRQVLEAAPDSAVARSKLGVALAQQGRLDEAIAEFSKALQLHPTYTSAYSNLANAYHAKGRLPEALAAYERALAIDPDYAIAHQNLGILYKQMGRAGEAVDHFKRATRLSLRRQADGTRQVRRGCPPTAGGVTGGAVACLGGVLRYGPPPRPGDAPRAAGRCGFRCPHPC